MADENTLLNSDLESRYEKYKGIIKNFTLMSDIFMRNVFKKRECLEYVLQVIMEKQDLYVIDQVIQKDYKNLQGRSAVMDCVARDSTSKQFDVPDLDPIQKLIRFYFVSHGFSSGIYKYSGRNQADGQTASGDGRFLWRGCGKKITIYLSFPGYAICSYCL